MANARTRYDTIAEFMTREHDATSTTQYGKPAVQINGTAFLFYMLPGMAFRLPGRSRRSLDPAATAVGLEAGRTPRP